MRIASLILGGLLFLLAGCDRVFSEEADRGRIVLGQSVDGVRLGADTTAIFERLGPPTRVQRRPGSVHYFYETGRYAGLEFYYDVRTGGRLAERSAIHLSEPYSGRTEEGIGIGSSRSDVVAALGPPPSSAVVGNRLTHDRYVTAAGNHLLFVYRDDVLESLGMAGRS